MIIQADRKYLELPRTRRNSRIQPYQDEVWTLWTSNRCKGVSLGRWVRVWILRWLPSNRYQWHQVQQPSLSFAISVLRWFRMLSRQLIDLLKDNRSLYLIQWLELQQKLTVILGSHQDLEDVELQHTCLITWHRAGNEFQAREQSAAALEAQTTSLVWMARAGPSRSSNHH